MSDEPNTLGWPETLQLPREVAARINRFFNVADAAATLIQRAHRGVRPSVTGPLAVLAPYAWRGLRFASSTLLELRSIW